VSEPAGRSAPDPVRAAGGVVWRPAARPEASPGAVEVLLVHRPRYDDWSIPKGKCDVGERDDACAVREVAEETGLRCTLGHELPGSEYVDGRGRPKAVRYWAMTVAEELDWEPGDEVDELAWLPVDLAERRLTYGRDVEVLDAFARWAGARPG
jgi:8-oxo-dGTP pyrophosphatase MutT (NUDIX family)